MWRRLPESAAQEIAGFIAKKPLLPRPLLALLATFLFIGAIAGILFLNNVLQTGAGKAPAQPFSLQNASLTSLIAIFAVTALFMYFLMVKNRKRPVVFVCYDCEEAFHAAAVCPACQSGNVSDIRFAEWIEDETE